MEKYGFVYIWFDRKHKRYYVGCHWGTEDDGYICSSTWMMQAYKIRPKDFKRKILKTKIENRRQTYTEEQRYLNMIKLDEIKIRYYNLKITQNETWHKYDKNIKTISQKISVKTKEAMADPVVRQNYLEGLKNRDTRSSDLEVRAKRSKSMIGKNKGNWAKAINISAEMRRGIPLSEEHRANIAAVGIFSSLNKKKIECKYCGFIGNPGNIGRYHNDKCKSK